MRVLLFVWISIVLGVSGAQAQDRRPSHCIAIADAAPGLEYLHKATWTDPVPEYSVRLEYISHASFLIQTHGGLNAVTDYTGFVGATGLVPDVVTMNHAHSTHWTPFPDPDIPNILPGWGPFGEGIAHNLDLGEMLVRNVSTDIRSTFSGVEPNGNSIFIFEVAGLCIGHLGHLPLAEMMGILRRLKSSVVLPMHWFSGFGLDTFLAGMADSFDIVRAGDSAITVSLATLPDRPTIVVLEPRFLTELE